MATNINNPFGKLTNYVLNPQQEEQKQPVQQPAQYAQAATLQQPAQPQQPIQPRQQPAPQMFGQPQQPQPAQPRQTTMTPVTAGQRYTQMLQQNVPQAQAVASGLAQQVTAPAAAAQRGFEEAQQQFAKTVAEKGLTRSTQRTQQLINKAALGQELTPEEFAELQKISTTRESFEEGTRPEDFMQLQEYVGALGEAQKARQYAGLLGSEAGKQQLLRQSARTPAYTSGQALMDALLAGGVAPAAEQLQQVQQRFGPTQDELAIAQQRMAEEAQRVKGEETAEIESAYKDIQDFLDAEGTGALANLEKTIQDRVAAENRKVEETNKLIDTVIPNIGNVLGDTEEEKRFMELLGIDPNTEEGKKLIRDIELAPKDFNLIEKLKEVNPQTVTSQEEMKKLQQLYKIADLVRREKPELAIQEGKDLGSLDEQKIKLDKEKLKSKVEEKKNVTGLSLNTEKQNISAQSVDPKVTREFNSLTFSGAIDSAIKNLEDRARRAGSTPKKLTKIPMRYAAIDTLLEQGKTQIEKMNSAYKDYGYPLTSFDDIIKVSDKEIDDYITTYAPIESIGRGYSKSDRDKIVERQKKMDSVREYYKKMIQLQKLSEFLKRDETSYLK